MHYWRIIHALEKSYINTHELEVRGDMLKKPHHRIFHPENDYQ
nr:hypothetical protein [Vibrio cholerae]